MSLNNIFYFIFLIKFVSGNQSNESTQISYNVTMQYNVKSLITEGYDSLTEISMRDNSVATIKLPFSFNFFEKENNYAYLSSNGLLSFSNLCDEGLSDCNEFVSGNYENTNSRMSTSRNVKLIDESTIIVVMKRHLKAIDMIMFIRLFQATFHMETEFNSNGTINKIFPQLRMFTIVDISASALQYLLQDEQVSSVRNDKKVQGLDPEPQVLHYTLQTPIDREF